MADQFLIQAPLVRAAGTDVPPEQIQAALNAIAQQVTLALNSLVGEPEPPSGPAGGDLGGTYPNPAVLKINGVLPGSMVGQNANAVAITGGAISGVTLSTSNAIGVASGGTGQNSLSAHNVLIGEGTAGVGFAAPGTAGGIFSSTGPAGDPAFQPKAALGIASSGANTDITSLAGLTTALTVGQGGTGVATLTQFNVLIGNAASAVAFAAPGTAGNVLTSTGATSAPTFQAIPWASPPAIGGTTPAAGSFTTLSSTGGAFNGTVGATTPGAGAFTTLAAAGNDALMYSNSTLQSFTTGVAATVTNWTKVSDRLNANFNPTTGVFTAPVSGIYLVTGQLSWAANTGGIGVGGHFRIVANGVLVADFFSPKYTTSGGMTGGGSIPVSLAAGQTIVIQALQDSGSTVTLSSTPTNNFMSITRIP